MLVCASAPRVIRFDREGGSHTGISVAENGILVCWQSGTGVTMPTVQSDDRRGVFALNETNAFLAGHSSSILNVAP